MTDQISQVSARRVWDSRGRPTVEVAVQTTGGARGRAIAPAGASRGSGEATDLRDGGLALGGLDVRKALDNVNTVIAPALMGLDVLRQSEVDAVIDELDPTPTRSSLGGNATVATSLAVVHAAAASSATALWRHLGSEIVYMPRPEIQIIGGGAHAAGRIAIQDFMVIPVSATRMDDALAQVAEVYHAVGELLKSRGPALGVADEGGHWPAVADMRDALNLLVDGIFKAGLEPGRDMAISLDIAASEFESETLYQLTPDGDSYSSTQWLSILQDCLSAYPILAVEDPMSERDHEGMRAATDTMGARCLIVGDDYLVTNDERIASAASRRVCNAALIKVNQAGTVTSARAAHDAARRAEWGTIVSARSGETEDVSVPHLAVGWQSDLVKVGSITRGERTAKWNELLRIDDELGGIPLAPLPRGLGLSIP